MALVKILFFGIVHLVELVVVDVGSLDDLDFSDLDVLDGVDGGDVLGDLLLDDLAGEHLEDVSDVGLGDLLGDNIADSFADDLLLGRKGVVSFALLVGGLLGEGDHEHSQDVSVDGLDVTHGLDEGLALLDQRADLVLGGVHAVETGDGLSALGLVNNQLDLPPVEAVLVGGEISLH